MIVVHIIVIQPIEEHGIAWEGEHGSQDEREEEVDVDGVALAVQFSKRNNTIT